MTQSRRWLLTDVETGTHLEHFQLSQADLPEMPGTWSVSKQTLRGGLSDGVERVTIDNGALKFHVLPTRGMGLWKGEFRGTFLGWKAPVAGPVHPKFVNLADRNGLGWLAGFDELLCRCGLVSNGPPGADQGTPLTLHGRIANLPAHRLELAIDPAPPHAISLSGVVDEGGLFLGRLRLTTTYSTELNSNRLTIHDVVENLSAKPAEMQILYHLNLGAPLLQAGSAIAVPFRELAPHTPHAAQALGSFDSYGGPVAGFAEEVFDFVPAGGADGRTLALLRNAVGTLGLAVRWNVRELPCFTVWKNTAAFEDGYVTGLEPGTNFPYFKSHERERGRVKLLPPGGRWEARWSMEVVDTSASVTALAAEVAGLQRSVKPTIRRSPAFGP